MKSHKILARERIQILYKSALVNAKDNPHISQQNVDTLRRISSKYRLPLPYEVRQSICKRCKMFIAPGIKAKMRICNSNVHITCGYCGHVYKKITKNTS
ncbi:MAG: RNase P subunit [Cenarchaeum symbiont of Oopsacas minuta]|nr:RNase P subunit [Cenarchaeum symbiont of Oopsacas minuta]